jgi:hypothetical protein
MAILRGVDFITPTQYILIQLEIRVGIVGLGFVPDLKVVEIEPRFIYGTADICSILS